LKRHAWNNPHHRSYSVAYWRVSELAAQRKLGLLPSGLLGTVLIIVIVLLLLGRL
jgi:hypothetical protein